MSGSQSISSQPASPTAAPGRPAMEGEEERPDQNRPSRYPSRSRSLRTGRTTFAALVRRARDAHGRQPFPDVIDHAVDPMGVVDHETGRPRTAVPPNPKFVSVASSKTFPAFREVSFAGSVCTGHASGPDTSFRPVATHRAEHCLAESGTIEGRLRRARLSPGLPDGALRIPVAIRFTASSCVRPIEQANCGAMSMALPSRPAARWTSSIPRAISSGERSRRVG
jgi:hypothetical protein